MLERVHRFFSGANGVRWHRRLNDELNEDGALAARAQAGDAEAFTILYYRYVERIFDFTVRRVESHDLAEDLVQTIFLRAVSALPSCRNVEAFGGWLFGIARHVVTDSHRQRPVTIISLGDDTDLPDGGRSVEEVVIQAEWARELHELRDLCLQEKDRELLDLRLQGLNDREIAVAQDRSWGSVRMAQSRLVMRLRECLGIAKERTHVRA
jgi:RNA polymerase sigma-70 factor (ECF subfamily)